MSEANLWKNIRDNLGHRVHFSRIEYNPSEGYPDLSYCRKSIEGHAELKFVPKAPVRMTTAVFGEEHGLRDSQVAWIHTRVKHGGRVAIVAQVGLYIFVIPGFEYRRFNQMTYFDLQRNAIWGDRPGWDRFLEALTAPLPRYLGVSSQGVKSPGDGGR